MKHVALAALIAIAAASAHAQTYLDNARVTSVDPQVESVRVPRQECSQRWISEPRPSNERGYGGAVLGGVAGAVIGHQVGGGHGRDAATALGAVLGAFAGNDLASRQRWAQAEPAAREVTTCRDAEDVLTRVVGYQVSYEYRGQQFTTLMQDKPGPYLQVRVSVDPVGR